MCYTVNMPRKKRTHRIVRTGGQKIAWTNTSRIPDDDVADTIAFVASHANLDATVIHFKGSGQRSRRWGRAYPSIPEIASMHGLARSEWSYLIIATDHFYPYVTREAVDTLAHEACHIEQFRASTDTYRAPRSEVQCRAFGAWVAELWEQEFCPPVGVDMIEDLV